MENKTRRQVIDELAEIAESVAVPKEKFVSLLLNKEGNFGNAVSTDLKLCIKLGRQTGIHVSPTVLFDGLQENSVSSGWELEQWKEFFKSKL